MKKITKLTAFLALLMGAFMMTSCSDDQETGMKLDSEGGTWWEGYMHVRSEYNGAIYDASRTEIYFEADWNKVRKGKGYWIDHYTDAPWGSYFASRIRWSVHEGIIDITFLDERDEHGNQVNMQIRDYYLSDSHFKGWVPSTNGGEKLEFDLHKVYRNDNYYNDYHYGWDDLLYDLLWSKPAAPGVTVERPAAPGTPKRVFE